MGKIIIDFDIKDMVDFCCKNKSCKGCFMEGFGIHCCTKMGLIEYKQRERKLKLEKLLK